MNSIELKRMRKECKEATSEVIRAVVLFILSASNCLPFLELFNRCYPRLRRNFHICTHITLIGPKNFYSPTTQELIYRIPQKMYIGLNNLYRLKHYDPKIELNVLWT